MKNKVVSIVLVGTLVAALAGCGQQGAENGAGTQGGSGSTEQSSESEESEEELDESTLRSDFTEEELADGQADFRVSRHLWVDAEVTPADVYADGFASYYLETAYQDGSMEEFTANPTLFGHPQEDFFELLSNLMGFSITMDLLEWNEVEGSVDGTTVDIVDGNGNPYYVSVNYQTDASLTDRYAYNSILYIEDFNHINLAYDAYGCGVYLSPEENDDTPLLTDEEIAAWKEALENLTGREISDIWDVTQVTEDKLELAGSMDDYVNWDLGTVDSYQFYYDLDGLPVDHLDLEYALRLGNPEPYADDTDMSGNTLHAANELPLQFITDGSRVLYLVVRDRCRPGEVYRETQPIISPSEILPVVEEYYPESSLTANVTITQVRLVYAPYFTDPDDGEICNAYCPVWKVVTYDERIDNSTLFVFDAVTGDTLLYGGGIPMN